MNAHECPTDAACICEYGPTDTPRPLPQGVLWVCIDCLLAREHGEVPPDRPADLPEVWSLLTDTEVTLGMV